LLTVLLTSPRVAPGLLSWQAWSALRSADRVVAPPGHPLLPALAEAGVEAEVTESVPDGGSGDVVWLAPAGQAEVPPGASVLRGSADLPGAHLLDLVVTMDRLRAECPWDAKQTHASLAPHLLEEPYEALEALETGDLDGFRSELGDVLLQVVFHARIAEDFTIDDVADGIVEKLIRRHPHVFGDVTVADAEEVKRNWDAIKRQEKMERAGVRVSEESFTSALDGVPFGQPALALAAQLQRRAARAGVPGELVNLSLESGAGRDREGGRDVGGDRSPGGRPDADTAAGPGAGSDTGPDIGAELFRLVAQARAAGLDPELELRSAARRYRDLVWTWEKSQATNQ
jgi:XTP/dITP diphosphohydrolase